MLPMVNGPRLLRYASSVSISSALAARVYSQKPMSTPSSRLPTWSRDKVGIDYTDYQGFDAEQSSGESKPFIRNVFTLNTCAHIVGSQVISFEDEAELLLKWREFVEEVDPDVVIGYNIANFDLPYLLDRAKALKAKEFPYLGRIIGMFHRCRYTSDRT